MLHILGFRAPGKANLPGTLGRHCLDLVPTFRAGCFLKSTVPAFSSFSDQRKGWMARDYTGTRARDCSSQLSLCALLGFFFHENAKVSHKSMSALLRPELSGAPVLDIQSRYRYSYSLSPYVFQLSQGIALYPSNSRQSQPNWGSKRGYRGSSCPLEAIAV